MCARYQLLKPESLADRFAIARLLGDFVISDDVRPTQLVAVVTMQRDLHPMRWGLIPSWTKTMPTGRPLINARAETIGEKPSFRRPLRSSRCIIPATGFYEWATAPRGKQKMLFTRSNGDLLAFAGLADEWTDASGRVVRSCAIVTTAANDTVAPIHDRMPVILRPEDEALWLDQMCHDRDELQQCLSPLPSEDLIACLAVAA